MTDEEEEKAPAAETKAAPDWNAEKIARKLAAMPDTGMTAEELAAQRAKARGGAMTDEEKKARGLLYDTSKARAVREESSDEEDEGAADIEGGDPFAFMDDDAEEEEAVALCEGAQEEAEKE